MPMSFRIEFVIADAERFDQLAIAFDDPEPVTCRPCPRDPCSGSPWP